MTNPNPETQATPPDLLNTMIMKLKTAVLAVALALTGGSTLRAQDNGALIDALVRKKILTDQEAEEIRADLVKEHAATSAGKLNISSSITELKLYGDARVRYQYENNQDQGGSGDADRSRFRYRLRLGAEVSLLNNFKAGVRIETGEANDSTNRDFGGYFDKVGDEVYVGLAYLQYTNSFDALNVLDVRVGKHLHPFFFAASSFNNGFWDTDINPEGISEQFGWGNQNEGFALTLRAGQYIISDTDNRATDPDEDQTGDNEDAGLYVGQVEFKYSFDLKTTLAVAPMFIAETSGDLLDEERGEAGPAGENPDAIVGDLAVLMVPMEVRWEMLGVPWRFFGSYGHNFSSEDRAQQAILAGDSSAEGKGDQANLFNVGLAVGAGKKQGDWSFAAEYRYTEAFAYTGNLNDSDFAKGLLNQQGFLLGVSYHFTDFLSGGVTWFHSNDIDSEIDIDNSVTTESDGHTIDVVQVDLNWKF